MDPLTTTYDHLDSNNFSDEAVNGIHVEDMLVNPAGNNSEQEGDEDEVFVYPIESSENAKLVNERPTHDNYSEDNEDFTYPSSETPLESPAQSSSFIVHLIKPNDRSNSHPTSAQLESVFTAGLSGNLELLQNLFDSITSSNDVEPFSLANDASPRTGLNVIHAASSRGHMNIVKWLIQECGGIPDLEDREGETSLHKAAMNGHLPVVSYLIFARANVHAQDGDGWTALHNACSKGYLDIVKWLCENSSAAEDSGDNHGVNVKSKGGWTPLMNAASKGHLPVVLYLLYKRSADPYIRNNWGETAYDIAAAVFEVWICEVLQKAEQEKWRCDPATYNLLAVHTTVPIVLYENQRLGSKMKNFPISSKRLKFTNSGLGRNGHRAAFELRAPISDGRKFWPAWRSEVQLPLLEDPFRMPKPLISTSTRDTIERSHFWLSDWTLDTTCPRVDAIEGWQYSQSFDNGEDDWSAEPNIQMASPVGHPRPIQTATIQSDRNSYGCVRRRRWVRLMRRRLDIDPLPYLQPDGVFYQVSNEGRMAPLTINGDSSIEGRELEDVQGPFLSLNQDYVSRARYLARTFSSAQRDTSPSPVSRRRAISKLQHAISDLETGIEGDGDHERKVQAEVLLNAYKRELDREREALGIPDDANLEDLPDRSNGYDSEDSFHYPGSISAETPSARPSSTHSSSDYFSRSSVTRTSADLTSSLIQSPDFRVPTHEAPQKLQVTHRVTPTPQIIHPQWERDETVSHCRACKRHFTILFRKHHCRRCGRIFCDRCSSYRAVLDVVDVVHDGSSEPTRGNPAYRVCESCFDEVNAAVPNRYQSSRNASMERIVVDEERLAIPSNLSREESNSQISDLAECPVCNQNLAQLGSASLQEAHVKTCLEGGSNALNQMAKYLVYKLPEESLLIGVECVICLEEFTKGCMVARLSCLCSFHNTCLSAWLQRGKNCPIHARDS